MPFIDQSHHETRFTQEHEWVRMEGDVATIGITNHAQEALGDIVFIELPEVGRALDRDEACAVVESVKAASDIYAPLAGTVVETNQPVVEDPAMVSTHAEGDGWFFKLRLADPSEFASLMDETEYKVFVESL
ncbi:MAG: glycine cleavage system protein GcvH [Acetobacteraceae bacterium]